MAESEKLSDRRGNRKMDVCSNHTTSTNTVIMKTCQNCNEEIKHNDSHYSFCCEWCEVEHHDKLEEYLLEMEADSQISQLKEYEAHNI